LDALVALFQTDFGMKRLLKISLLWIALLCWQYFRRDILPFFLLENYLDSLGHYFPFCIWLKEKLQYSYIGFLRLWFPNTLYLIPWAVISTYLLNFSFPSNAWHKQISFLFAGIVIAFGLSFFIYLLIFRLVPQSAAWFYEWIVDAKDMLATPFPLFMIMAFLYWDRLSGR
jgi:hypothetical protein